MKSPITGKEMLLINEERVLSFRKEEFKVVYHYYLCKDSGEQFTDNHLDELNIVQVYNQYRSKYNIPFPEEIKAIREKYGLSAAKMADILGFGTNVYRNYESGEVPSLSNAKLIHLAKEPEQFKNLVKIAETLDEPAKEKLVAKIDSIIHLQQDNPISFEVEDYLIDGKHPNEFNGYKSPSLAKLTEMVVFLTSKLEPWKTQLNKLLFYSDFAHYKRTGYSISGAQYVAIDMGPVPNKFNSLFDYMANTDSIDIYTKEFEDGGIGEHFKPNIKRKFNADLFSQTELQALADVVLKFKGKTTKDMIRLSHEETAWLLNHKTKSQINYNYAFKLKNI